MFSKRKKKGVCEVMDVSVLTQWENPLTNGHVGQTTTWCIFNVLSFCQLHLSEAEKRKKEKNMLLCRAVIGNPDPAVLTEVPMGSCSSQGRQRVALQLGWGFQQRAPGTRRGEAVRAGAAAASLLNTEHHPSSRGGAPPKAPFGSWPRSWNRVWTVPETPPSGQSTVPSLGYMIRSTPSQWERPGQREPRAEAAEAATGTGPAKAQAPNTLASCQHFERKPGEQQRSWGRSKGFKSQWHRRSKVQPLCRTSSPGKALASLQDLGGTPGSRVGTSTAQGAANAAPTRVRDQGADRAQKTQKPCWPGGPQTASEPQRNQSSSPRVELRRPEGSHASRPSEHGCARTPKAFCGRTQSPQPSAGY